ncbi:MAG: hypothetical protein N2205_01530 [Candidatus Caldatribacterium sp.]|uniref:hypothetical protein n=1 Tax=Candidatus Caldatribacterium sp. TaxID=2282143 RepID=UPI00299A3FBF|nr:hypothetical protein [Candidatus Caldatribacterium sp.]MCX7729884.1 hypothetical protein [Candidatus Caldatribacterium sp.]MDW8081628.1 hypothetical protein [Candidatus Calescibacterium sp.]
MVLGWRLLSVVGALVAFWVSQGLAQYISVPQEAEVLVLSGLTIEKGKVCLRVPSKGCVRRGDIVAQVVRETQQDGILHCVVTFLWKVQDLWNGAGEVVISFDLREDLHLDIPCAISVTHPVRCLVAPQHPMLVQDLIRATIFALESEIKRYTERDDGGQKEKVVLLSKELERFKSMSPAEYRLSGEEVVNLKKFGVLMPPQLQEVEVLAPPQKLGDILEVVGMTRSGPFYHVAGIRGGTFSHFLPSRRYRMTLYLVFRREYFAFIPNYYVYIADWEEM